MFFYNQSGTGMQIKIFFIVLLRSKKVHDHEALTMIDEKQKKCLAQR
jgi:hypothetical protein